MTDSVVLGRSAKAVLDAFAKLQRKAGDTLRYEDIFHCLGDAQVARIGQRELICKGLAIEHQYSLELTPAGYGVIAPSESSATVLHGRDSCEHQTQLLRSIKPGLLHLEPSDPGAAYVLKRFALKLGLLLVFAFAQIWSP